MAASTRCRIWPGPQTTLRESLDKYLKDLEFWSGQLDSNQRPAVPKTAALPGCAIPRLSLGKRCRYTLKALPARRLAATSVGIKERVRDAVSWLDAVFFRSPRDHLQHPLRQPP